MRADKVGAFLSVAVFVLMLLVIGQPFYVVPEGMQAVITQFGSPVGGPITAAGLHLKTPFVQKVNMFEKRIMEWDGDANQIPTRDKKYIWVDTTARWRIVDPLLFMQSVRNEQGGQGRLDGIIDAAVRDIVTSNNLIDVVRSSNDLMAEMERDLKAGEFIEEGAFEKISVGREKMRVLILARARELVPEYGIEIIDVRIKRLNYVDDVRQKVYERMIAERKRAAEMSRSEGRGISAEIEGKTERELLEIKSQAYKEAEEIKGAADATAAQIYADAYNADPDFYAFTKTLATYRESVDQNTTVILTTDADYFTYLKHSSLDQGK